jgi:tRNA 2-thiouridine synthesizing protein A
MEPKKADIVIDAREMEPPEPFVVTMDALDAMDPSHTLLLILTREPHPLYRALLKQGYAYSTAITADYTIEILIWRKAA